MSAHYQWQSKDLILLCHIQPGAKKTEFAGLHGERLKVRLNAPPVDGKANSELIKFISKAFAVSKSRVILESGELNRQKKLRIISPSQLPEQAMINV